MSEDRSSLTGVDAGRLVSVPMSGAEIACHVGGNGPTLLLLHPVGLDSRIWVRQRPAFERFYTVVAVDKRGHGRSVGSDKPYEPSEDIARVLAYLNIDELSVLGLGEGADYALRLAACGDFKVKALVLAMPVLPWVTQEVLLEDFEQREAANEHLEHMFSDPDTERVREAVRVRDEDALAEMVASDPGALSEGHPDRGLLRDMTRTNIAAIYELELAATPGPSVRSAIRSLELPILALSNQSDDLDAGARALLEDMSDVTEIALPTSSTLINLERSDLFNEAVVDFLRARWA